MTTYTYADMQARIAFETMRGDLSTNTVLTATSAVQLAIQDSIKQYEGDRFYFSDKAYASWPTVIDQETYSTSDAGFPADLVEIDALTIIYGSQRWRVRQVEWDEIEFWQNGTSKGSPASHFAYYQQKIRLYPIPTAVNTLNLAYWQSPAAVSADGDVGPWMNDAEELIRSSAKRRLFMTVVPNEQEADLCAVLEEDAQRVLKKKTALRTGTGRIRPTRF